MAMRGLLTRDGLDSGQKGSIIVERQPVKQAVFLLLVPLAAAGAALAAPSWQEESALRDSRARDELDNRPVAT
jgi:hypothetical protein